ncbi:MAG: DNA repair protein RecN [Anaerolineae bacterium]
MLCELSISNFAIIEKLNVRLGAGFNVLTGETGAGKSIIIDALSTILGGRVTDEPIRSGADQARVEGVFAFDERCRRRLLPLLREYGLDDEQDQIILTREINRGERNVCRVNGRAVTLRLLEQIGQVLVDIHGQTEHLSLRRVKEHMDYLDRYGGLDQWRAQVTSLVEELREVRDELRKLQQDERELARLIDRLEYQIQEIRAAKLRPGEEQELQHERTILSNAEHLATLVDEAYQTLGEERDEQKSVLDLLGEITRVFGNLSELDPVLKEQEKVVEGITFQVEDLIRTVRSYRDSIEFNPARLRQVEERLDLIFSLKRKYGDTVEEVLQYAAAAERELEGIAHSEERIEELQAREAELLVELGRQARELSHARRQAADRLAAAMERELEDLNMKRARFAVAVEQVESEDGVEVDGHRYAFDSTGIDRVQFLISPNVGEPLKSVARIASGGETSRLMLALKTVLSAADEIPTLIFDEIDVGVGGRTGAVVGRKLWKLTRPKVEKPLGLSLGTKPLVPFESGPTEGVKHQVICVTHLPQIAAFSDDHYKVDKEVVRERTVTTMVELGQDERINELTQMLGSLGEMTHRTAQEIYEESQRWKEEQKEG